MDGDQGPGETTEGPPRPPTSPARERSDIPPVEFGPPAGSKQPRPDLSSPGPMSPSAVPRLAQQLYWRAACGTIRDHFARLPSQCRVAELLLREGATIAPGGVHVGRFDITDASIARATGVDRRIVANALDAIRSNPCLAAVFAPRDPLLMLADAAQKFGWGILDVLPADPHAPGLLAHVAFLLAEEGISIRQVIAEDPVFAPDPHLYVITEAAIPPHLQAKMAAHPAVRAVAVLR